MAVTAGVYYQAPAADGMTMDGMTPAHAKPAARRDHLWVLAVIAACCLIKVWPSWVGIGAEAGFPKLGRMATDWTLAVVVEAYWAYAVYAWLAADAGRRSRRFAWGSAAGVFILSVVCQSAAPVMAAAAVKVFANALPVVVLALIAILVHLRHVDRAESDAAEQALAEAEREAQQAASEANERAGLEAAVSALTSDLETAVSTRADAEQRAAEALTRAESLAAKLAAKNAQGKRGKNAQDTRKSAHDEDITTEFRALDELQKDRTLRAPRMGAELGRRIGVSPATGRRLHAKLTAQDRPAEPLSERSAGQSGERSGERS